MRIGELAKRVGVNSQTIRFYEREGLLSPPSRDGNGYRSYSDSSIGEVVFIRECQGAGFTLKEIKWLKGLDPKGPGTCGEVSELLRQKTVSIDEKIDSLRRLQDQLIALEKQCRTFASGDSCPVLEDLHG